MGLVGIFSLSTQLLTISGMATGIISQISNTTFAKLAHDGDVDKIYRNYERITRINIYISAPFFAAFIAESQNLMAFFGESYLGNNMILILLTISSMIECITGPCGSILMMSGREKENLIASISKFVVFLLLLAILIRFTVLAAPISLIVSTITSNGLKLIMLKHYYKKNFFSKNIVLVFLVLFIICFGVFFAIGFIKNTIAWVLTNAIMGVGLIIASIFVTPFKEDKKYFTKGKEI